MHLLVKTCCDSVVTVHLLCNVKLQNTAFIEYLLFTLFMNSFKQKVNIIKNVRITFFCYLLLYPELTTSLRGQLLEAQRLVKCSQIFKLKSTSMLHDVMPSFYFRNSWKSNHQNVSISRQKHIILLEVHFNAKI